ncbi:MAG: hypothetical protein VW618_04125 [Alphaproteobacteria bacterium]
MNFGRFRHATKHWCDPSQVIFLMLIFAAALLTLNAKPGSLLGSIGNVAEGIFNAPVDALEWAVPIVLIGAVVVVTVWLLLAVLRYAYWQ